MTSAAINHENDSVRWGIVSLITLFVFVGILGPKLLWMDSGYASLVRSWPLDVQFVIHPTMRMLLVLLGWVLVMRMRASGTDVSMGLLIGWRRAFMGIGIGLLCSLPMLILGFMSTSFTPNRYEIMHMAIAPGLTEEIFYRAFLFGLLVQVARCPVWTTAIITGIVFGLAHVDITPDEGKTIVGQLGPEIAMISLGGFMYAWLFWESRWNLWLVIALHASMNLWWDMFDLSVTPLGSWGATGARVLSVGLVVLLVFGLRVLGPGPGATIGDEQPATDA